ncbi:MAG TPA: hypothetical protein VKM54_25175, partial [Myxococcota bacterium]|nr:hypothetical protein [Myxococcota bacterium]
PRPEDEAPLLCEHPARRAASLVPGMLEACTAALRAPCAGHLRVAREAQAQDEHGLVSGLELDTRRDPVSALIRSPKDDEVVPLPPPL